MKTPRPRNVTELAALLSEAQKRAPDYPEGWTRKEIEADLTRRLCGDGTPDNPGLLSAEVQKSLLECYGTNTKELFLRQLDALAELSLASDDPEIQADGRMNKSWCAPRLQAFGQQRTAKPAEVSA